MRPAAPRHPGFGVVKASKVWTGRSACPTAMPWSRSRSTLGWQARPGLAPARQLATSITHRRSAAQTNPARTRANGKAGVHELPPRVLRFGQ
jgi:hypothetical protein